MSRQYGLKGSFVMSFLYRSGMCPNTGADMLTELAFQQSVKDVQRSVEESKYVSGGELGSLEC